MVFADLWSSPGRLPPPSRRQPAKIPRAVREAAALFRFEGRMTITSPHNEKLKLIHRLGRRRTREREGLFVGEGEDLLAAARAAGADPVELLTAAGEGLGGTEVEPELLARFSTLGSGTRAIGVWRQRWAEASSAPASISTGSPIRGTSAPSFAPPRPWWGDRWCWAPTAPIPTGRAPSARAWAPCSPSRWSGLRSSRPLSPASRSSPTGASPSMGSRAQPRSASVPSARGFPPRSPAHATPGSRSRCGSGPTP
jgi:hypothetical protein